MKKTQINPNDYKCDDGTTDWKRFDAALKEKYRGEKILAAVLMCTVLPASIISMIVMFFKGMFN